MASPLLIQQFTDAIDDCRRLYVDGVIECYLADPQRLDVGHDEFFDDLQHRFACLVIKAFVETAESDLVLTPAEAELAVVMVQHVLKQRVRRSRLRETFGQLSEIAKQHSWGHVTQPLVWFEQTREYFEQIKSDVLRIANIAAKIDGHASAETISQLKMIRLQLDQFLPQFDEEAMSPESQPKDDAAPPDQRLSAVLIQMIKQDDEPGEQPPQGDDDDDSPEQVVLSDRQREEALDQGLRELEGLVGIEQVQHEVRTLMNLCKLQQHRADHEMPVSPVSLHMLFTGNPGTGKTTVARIVGKLLGAMGIIQRGHLVETDRSGLVAEYLGQTAKKTNEKIDEALDGVLFIDEAYSLAPASQADGYGQEAVQTLLKRMEDDRERLVVILAGYPEPMETMLRSNPGLTSRFSRRCHFPDYGVEELCEIFQNMAAENRYQLTDRFQQQLTEEIQSRIDEKDEHFGNGRTVRNLFENAIRNLANRVVTATDLTPELLSTFQPEDLRCSTKTIEATL